MIFREALGASPRWLVFLLALFFMMLPYASEAHRPDESYVYLMVSEGPLEGEFHVRVSDMAKAVPLDTDGDGIITDEEVLGQYDAIVTHLTERMRLFDGADIHTAVPGEMAFFGQPDRRQMLLKFTVPSINPPPDALEAEFRFLYDSVDADHRPMLLIKSNERMRLRYNESHVTLEFESGADRQSVSLVPPPFAQRVTTTFRQGFMLILNNQFHILIALAAVVGSLRWHAQAPASSATATGLARNVALVALLFGVGFASGLLFKEYVPFRASSHEVKNILASALGLAAVAALLVSRPVLRGATLLAAGGLCGLSIRGFGPVVGLNKGYIEIVYPGLAAGIFVATCLLAVVVLPVGFVLFRQPERMDKVIRIASIALVSVACLFLFQRLVLM